MGWRERASSPAVDYRRLSSWLVEQVGGTFFTGAHYYTGVEDVPEPSNRLASFLDMLEYERGYFVYRFARKARTLGCASCGAENHYTTEKEVDTTMVADMLRLTAVNAFDVLVLVSGDADHAPALEGVRALGKVAYVATWGGSGLSPRLRKAAFDHIDLLDGLARFRAQATSGDDDETLAHVFLQELARAEAQFSPGYVGVNYFVTKWQSDKLQAAAVDRRRVLEALVSSGAVEVYDAPNGERAMRRVR